MASEEGDNVGEGSLLVDSQKGTVRIRNYENDYGGEGQTGTYKFDKIFTAENDNRLTDDVLPLAMSVLSGYNTTVFAYGQTGSGKTHVMDR